MLFDLSESLIQINKITEACNIMQILVASYPNNKLIKKTNESILDNQCINLNQ